MKEPKLRFPEFTGAWEQRKLGECAEFNPKSELPDIFEYVDLESVVGTKILSHRTESKSSAPSRAQRLAQKGDVFYQTVRPYQKNNCIFEKDDNNWVFSTGYAQLRPVNNGYFLLTLLQNEDFVKLVLDRCTGTSYPAINSNDLADIDVNIPSDNKEQQKIGTYFKNLDNLIQSAEKELEGYRELKQGMLQKMFPKKGEAVPEIRFPEFDGSWELCKISELCSVATGKSNTQDKVEDGKYPFYVRSPIVERSTKYLYDEEAVITVGDGVGTGKVFHYVNGKYDLHQRCYRMYGFSDKLNAHYFYYVFSKLFYKRVKSMTAKTSVDSVRMEMIVDMKIPVPTIEEQIKIGTYFDNLDNLIALQQKEIDGYKELKKGLLQQMFC